MWWLNICIGEVQSEGEKSLPVEFSDKTNQLLDYIERTYLKGLVSTDKEGKNIMEKMRLAENSNMVNMIEVLVVLMLLLVVILTWKVIILIFASLSHSFIWLLHNLGRKIDPNGVGRKAQARNNQAAWEPQCQGSHDWSLFVASQIKDFYYRADRHRGKKYTWTTMI